MSTTPRFRPGDRFEHLVIEAEIGRGAYAVVYRAHDTVLDRRVALKVLAPRLGSVSQEGAPSHARALKEARLVARLSSPHVVPIHRVHDLGAAGLGLEMECLEGGSLAARLHDGEALPAAEAQRMLEGLASALHAAHGLGVLHRDVKPENVLLGREGEPKLSDFGLGHDLTDDALSGSDPRRLRGTPLYMAPEVVMGQPATAASDLWSLGVLGYRLLSGALPFHGTSLPSLFYAILNEAPEPLEPEVPRPLARAVLSCLDRDPARRPASAARLLDDLRAVASPAPRSTTGSSVALPVEATVLCGREPERAALDPVLERLRQGQGGALLVHGEAGIGKSELLRALRASARTAGLRWVEATVTGFGGVHQPLLRAVRRWLSGESRDPEAAMAISTSRFGAAAPALRTLLEGEVYELQGAQQLVWALEQLLRGLGKERPTVVLVEDAHLCDAQDLKLVKDLVLRLVDAPVLLAFTWRTHDLGASDSLPDASASFDALAQTPGVTPLALGPLDPSALLLLVERRTGARHVHPEVFERVREGSDGNPLYAQELVRHLLEEHEVVVERGEARPGPRWGQAETPSQLKALLSRRLTGLGDDVRSLLDAAAVDGAQFDAAAVAAVQGVPLLTALRQFQSLHRDRGIVVPLKSGFRFLHATFRDVLYEELSPDLRRALHRSLAEHLESRGGLPDDERLGFHWHRAGDQARARPYLASAAGTSARQQQYVRALRLARDAGLLDGQGSPEDARIHSQLLFGIAGVLSDLGRHAEARALIERTAAAAERLADPVLADQAAVWAADMHYWAEGAGSVDVESLVAAADRLPPCVERGRGLYVAGLVQKAHGRVATAEALLVRAGEILRAIGSLGESASVEHERASLARLLGRFEDAEVAYARAARGALEAGRPTDAAVSEILRGLTRLERGSLEGVRECIAGGIRVLRLAGSRERAAHATAYLARVDTAEGRLEPARELLKGALAELGPQGGVYARIEVLVDLADVEAGLGANETAADLLAQARAAVDAGGDADDRVALETTAMRCALIRGDVCDAEARALAAVEACRSLPPPNCTAALLAFHLAAGALMHLGEEPLRTLSPMLQAAGEQTPPLLSLARTLAPSGMPDGAARWTFAAARALQRPDVGWRLTERRIVALFLEARALAVTGQTAAAQRRTSEARAAAASLDHRWLRELEV